MSGPDLRGRWRRFLALPPDSTPKALSVALLVSLVAALVVSFTAVTLRPLQQANLERERQAQIVGLVSRAIGSTGPLTAYVIELSSGRIARDMDPVTYDQRAAARDTELSTAIPEAADIAGLGRRADFATVFARVEEGKPVLIVLPLHGAGYQSTMYGYLALEGDANTVSALTFYEQSETPGLGARIAEADWQGLWAGKQLADADGTLQIRVVRGVGQSVYEVDGISGATRTGNGITNLMRFWLGDSGFAPFLRRVKAGELEL